MSDFIGVMYLGRLVETGSARRVFNAPQHPYTRLLLDTIPDVTMTRRDRQPMAGEVPNPISPPPGCPFHPRCTFANARCRAEVPALRQTPTGVHAACHAVEEGRRPRRHAPRHCLRRPDRGAAWSSISARCRPRTAIGSSAASSRRARSRS
jgi:peptide/nickel transport system ATP-binding protein